MKNNDAKLLIQVCYNLTPSNQDREINGLSEAMQFFDKNEGILVTFNQEDFIIHNDKKIEVIPAYKFISMLNSNNL